MGSTEPTWAVVWPLGKQRTDSVDLPARLDDLGGKVVAELWDWLYEGDRAFPIIEEELARRFPGISFVNYSVFGDIHGADELEVVERLPELLREHGIDAVIAGVGH
jgi:hypothetical protein